MRFLIIQTAFLGDVVLATPLIEKLRAFYPEDRIDFLVRKGNESLLKDHPLLDDLLVWNKQEHKMRNLWGMMREVRSRKYDYVINVQRFASSGLITVFSKAYTIGFDKNPLSRYFTEKKPHVIGSDPKHYQHEVQRNLSLIAGLTDGSTALDGAEGKVRPKLYPSETDYEKVAQYKDAPYITMSPASVWFTKQLAREKWTALIRSFGPERRIYLLGAPGDKELCEKILEEAGQVGARSLCGHLSLLQSAALMEGAQMNYVNDSAPMHLASAMNAPVTAVYCSTVPYFGFGPLSEVSRVVETPVALDCRPCGLHGYKACPLGHFKCAHTIPVALLRGDA
jgi:heptosyltransferase-2